MAIEKTSLLTADSQLLADAELPAGGDLNNERLKNRFVPQRVWRNGLLILGKGTREERRDIIRQLGVKDIRTQTRQAILKRAKEFSITV